MLANVVRKQVQKVLKNSKQQSSRSTQLKSTQSSSTTINSFSTTNKQSLFVSPKQWTFSTSIQQRYFASGATEKKEKKEKEAPPPPPPSPIIVSRDGIDLVTKPPDPEIKILNKRMTALIQEDKIAEARKIFDEMKAKGPRPNVPSYYTMIKAAQKEGNYPLVQQLTDEMRDSFAHKSKVSPTGRTVIRPYRPKYRTAPWALLIALFRNCKDSEEKRQYGMTREEVIAVAQNLSDVSFFYPEDYNGFYTGWSSMGTLVRKNLIVKEKEGAATKYYLTDSGFDLAFDLDLLENKELGEAKQYTRRRGHKGPEELTQKLAEEEKKGREPVSNDPRNAWMTKEIKSRIIDTIKVSQDQFDNVLRKKMDKYTSDNDAHRKVAAILIALDIKKINLEQWADKQKNTTKYDLIREVLASLQNNKLVETAPAPPPAQAQAQATATA